MTKAEIIEELKKFGVEATMRARKDVLEELLEEKQMDELAARMPMEEMPMEDPKTCTNKWMCHPCLIKAVVVIAIIVVIGLVT